MNVLQMKHMLTEKIYKNTLLLTGRMCTILTATLILFRGRGRVPYFVLNELFALCAPCALSTSCTSCFLKAALVI